MSKVTGPLFSVTASGPLARAITFVHQATGHVVRRLPSVIPPASATQQTHRDVISAMAACWKAQTPATRADWNARGPAFSMSGYQLWWSEWLSQNSTCEDPPTLP